MNLVITWNIGNENNLKKKKNILSIYWKINSFKDIFNLILMG